MQDAPQSKPPRPGLIARLSEPMATAVLTLGITQIIGWGTSLYVLGVLGGPIAAETGWSRAFVFGGLTVGLLVSAAISTFIGRMIDQRGGRLVMCIGSILTALGLGLLAVVPNEAAYLAVWALLGVSMRMTLYDAAFAAIVQVTPSRGRRAISYLTLFGGFASSVFWPIGHALAASTGWRATLLVFAALNLLVCLPLHWLGLARRESASAAAAEATGATASAAPSAPLVGRNRTIAMVLFAAVLSACAFVFGALSVHLPAVLQSVGLTAAAAVTLASLKGVAQVGGRLWELLFAKGLAPLSLARVAIAALPLCFLTLLVGPAGFATALVFITLLGFGNGLVTIVRGAAPLALFGTEGYGRVLGILATPYLLLNAVAPMLFALLVDNLGYGASTLVLFACALLASLAMELMALWYRRRA